MTLASKTAVVYMNKSKIELLSPAGNLPAAIAAIRCGADAVYIGPSRFSAREAAANSIDDIARVIDFAHLYFVRVYAAVNTLLYDHELPIAEKLIHSLYNRGIDGLIIQDPGLLELDLPPIPLIASTQMHNDTLEKVQFLEAVGFSRAILARELTLDQIANIRRHTSIELECFVHGALCVSMSGQCYASYALGGRSGNRGQCAQPCRKLYRLTNQQGQTLGPDRYYLSLKDLNLAQYLGDLLDAGITSFKIEGRLKNPEYVANITAYYRRQLDDILLRRNLRKASSGNILLGFSPHPAKTFNRGFTDYGLTNSPSQMGSLDTPKSVGEKIGTVRRIARNYFELDNPHDLHNADGICFFDPHHHLLGTVINGVDGAKVYPQKMVALTPGTKIFRNYDHPFHKQLKTIPAQRKITLRMRLYEIPQGIALEGIDEDGLSATVTVEHPKEPAKNPDAARRNITQQLQKLGQTLFICTAVTLDLQTICFFPVSLLNRLRNDLTEALLKVRLQNRSLQPGGVIKNNVPYPLSVLDFRGNVLNDRARAFYRRHGVTKIDPAAESGLDLNGQPLMHTKFCLRRELNLCPGSHPGQPAAPLLLTDRENHCLELRFRCGPCGSCGMDLFLK